MDRSERACLIADRLTEAFKNSGKSLYGIEKRLAITSTQSKSYMRGKHIPFPLILADLCEYLGVSMDWVCGLEG